MTSVTEWKYLLILCLLVLFGCRDSDSDGRSEELSRIIAEILEPAGLGEDDVLIYGSDEPLQPGDVIVPHGPDAPDAQPTSPRVLERPTWLFWIDLQPRLNFAHDTLFIYIDAETGELTTESHSWFPVVNDEPFWTDEPLYGDIEQFRAGPPTEPAVGDLSQDPAAAEVDACRGTKHAIVIGGFNDPYGWIVAGLPRKEMLYTKYGYQVHVVNPLGLTPDEVGEKILAAFAEVDASDRIDELLIHYNGHGWEGGGWVLGPDTLIYPGTLVDLITPLETDEVTLINDSCFSGRVAADMMLLLAEAGVTDKHVHILSAASSKQRASMIDGDGAFSAQLFALIEAESETKRLPWETFEVPHIEVAGITPDKQKKMFPQDAETVVLDIPVIDQYQDEVSKECWVGHVTETQYDRRISIRGHGFGDDKGVVHMQTPDEQWVPIKVDFWRDDAITMYVPMRADGFPHDDMSGFTPLSATNGHYNVRVTRTDAAVSDPIPGHWHFIHIVLQQYWQDWTANFPDEVADPPGYRWVEMWHHLTLEPPEVTKGPTIQMARLYHSSEGDPDLSMLSNDTYPGFEISPAAQASMSLGDWTWDLAPGVYDPETSFLPEPYTTNYYGFRMRFSDTYNDGPLWKYVLAYD